MKKESYFVYGETIEYFTELDKALHFFQTSKANTFGFKSIGVKSGGMQAHRDSYEFDYVQSYNGGIHLCFDYLLLPDNEIVNQDIKKICDLYQFDMATEIGFRLFYKDENIASNFKYLLPLLFPEVKIESEKNKKSINIAYIENDNIIEKLNTLIGNHVIERKKKDENRKFQFDEDITNDFYEVIIDGQFPFNCIQSDNYLYLSTIIPKIASSQV